MMDIIRILSTTAKLQIKQSLARPMFQFCLLVNPIANMIFLYELYFNRDFQDFISYGVLGSCLMGIWSCICFSSIGDINRERHSGTLPFIYVAPGGFGIIIMGKILGNMILSIVTFAISFVTATILSGKMIVIENIAMFALSFVMMILCFVVVSICFSYILMLSRKTELYMNLLEIPMIFICGFTFPIEILPSLLKVISNCIPITWAVKILRMGVVETNLQEYLFHVVILLTQLFILVGITLVLYQRINKEIRIKGTLEVR